MLLQPEPFGRPALAVDYGPPMLGDKPSWDRNAWFESLDASARHELVFSSALAWDEWLGLLDDGGREYARWLWDAFTELGEANPEGSVRSEVTFDWPVLAAAHVLHGLRDQIETYTSSFYGDDDAQALIAAGADPVVLGRLLRTALTNVISRFFYNLDSGINHDLWDDRLPGWALMETDITGLIDRPTEDGPDDAEVLTGRKIAVNDYFMTDTIASDEDRPG